MPQCKLCQEEKELIKKSHIIPDFMYQGLYDEKHRLRKITPLKYVKGEKKVELPQTGEYEGNILCKKCDNEIIGRLESYASSAIYGKTKLAYNENPIIEFFKIENDIFLNKVTNIDYTKFKLFLLSILWRSHISSQEFFKEINLGDNAETIRRMILDGNPDEKMIFPSLYFTFIMDSNVSNNIVAQPSIIKMQENKVAVFIIHGFIYLFHIEGDNVPEYFNSSTINQKNEMTIIHLPEGISWELILKYSGLKA